MIRGKAAVVMWCDVAPSARAEFEDWHTHEHMPERLSIPGFNRGSRWRDAGGGEANFHMYEAESLATVTAGPYLERLDNPTPWSRAMMPHHRNMVRSLCEVVASHGAGLGRFLLALRLSRQPGREAALVGWLADLPRRRGIAAAHFLKDAGTGPAALTAEQRIRGSDTRADWILLLNGYERDAVAAIGAEQGGSAIAGLYALDYVLAAP